MSLWAAWEALYTDIDRPDHRQAAREFYEGAAIADARPAPCCCGPRSRDSTRSCACGPKAGIRHSNERSRTRRSIRKCANGPETYFDELVWFDHWPRELRVKVLALDPSKGDRLAPGRLLGPRPPGRRSARYAVRRSRPQAATDAANRGRRRRTMPHVPTRPVRASRPTSSRTCWPANSIRRLRQAGILSARPAPIDNRVNKQVRIRRLGPYLSSSRIRFKANSPGTRLLVEQLGTFPIGDHDDGPDALEMAVRLAAGTARPAQ